MLFNIKRSLLLLDTIERFFLVALTISRAILGLLDIAGIFLVGLLLAKASNQITNNDYGNETLDFVSKISGNLDLIQIAILALVLFVSKSILASLLMKYMTVRFARSEGKKTTSVYENILRSPIAKVSSFSKPEIVYSLTYSSGFAIVQMLTITVIIFSEIFLLIFISAVFALVDLQLTFYIVVYFAIIGALIYRTIGSQFAKAGKKYANSAIEASATVEDSLVTFREIFTQGKQDDFKIKFEEARSELAKSVASINFLTGLPRYIVESALMVGAIGLAAYALSSSDPTAAAGTLGIFLTGGLRIMASMLPLQNALGTLKQLTSQADSFLRLVQEFPSELNEHQHHHCQKSTGTDFEPIEVKLDSISYIYDGAEYSAVKDVSLSIPAGSTAAFIGASGSGKSTLADLIVGLLIPTSGEIILTNNDSQNIGYVPQSPGIIRGTIRENITLEINSKNFDLERLNNALAVSHLQELIETLENGVSTELGAQSDGLSGGQLQRIGLARAIYANPGLLVLDEATSALDAETEAAVSDSLRTLHGKCTTIVIAHRLSTIQNVDMVFVFDKGEVVASGKFSELVASNEIVARFVELSSLDITD